MDSSVLSFALLSDVMASMLFVSVVAIPSDAFMIDGGIVDG